MDSFHGARGAGTDGSAEIVLDTGKLADFGVATTFDQVSRVGRALRLQAGLGAPTTPTGE